MQRVVTHEDNKSDKKRTEWDRHLKKKEPMMMNKEKKMEGGTGDRR